MTIEKTFESVALVDPPLGVCQRCSESAMLHTPTGTKFAYCEHTGTGAMLTPGSSWYMVENVTAANFKQAVLIAVMEGEAQYIDQQVGGMLEN